MINSNSANNTSIPYLSNLFNYRDLNTPVIIFLSNLLLPRPVTLIYNKRILRDGLFIL